MARVSRAPESAVQWEGAWLVLRGALGRLPGHLVLWFGETCAFEASGHRTGVCGGLAGWRCPQRRLCPPSARAHRL